MRYTLDRIEDGHYVFLAFPDEEKQLLLPVEDRFKDVKEGDIVEIELVDGNYHIEVLEEETAEMKDKVRNLLEKLKNKN